jgi:hypothetical protein
VELSHADAELEEVAPDEILFQRLVQHLQPLYLVIQVSLFCKISNL